MRGDRLPFGDVTGAHAQSAAIACAPDHAHPDDGLLLLLADPLTGAPPLHVAVLLAWDAPTLWSSRQVGALLPAAFLDVSVVRITGGDARPARPPRAYAAYHALCARTARLPAVDPLSPAAWPAAVVARPSLALAALEGGATCVDVVLDLSGAAPGAALARSARHGVWTYRHGGDGATAACFAEMERRAPLTCTRLVARAPAADGPAVVLAEAACATTATANVIANRAAPYWGAEHLALQKLRELHGRGWHTVRERAPSASTVDPVPADAAAARPLTSGRIARWALRNVARRALRRAARAPTLTDWCVALRRATAPLPERDPQHALDAARYLPNPVGRFLADPFLVQHEGRTWLFVEDYAFDRRRGTIACGEVLADGTVHELRSCLERPHHVSYPHVFRHDGSAWMVPESERAGTVDLYRATSFPYAWRYECTLLRLRCVDPTVFPHAGRWWLYATHVPVPGVDVATLLFEAPTLHGPWRLHERSPVVADVRRARCAGPPFVHAGRLLRPAQDGARHYGRALVLNEVRRLASDDYAEAPVHRYEPPLRLGVDGLHHYSRCGDWEAFDVRLQSPLRRFAAQPVRSADGRTRPVTLAGALTPRR